jgi:hypothetical protein
MKEIKLTIDGKDVQLTDEQLKALGIEVRKNPFERVEPGDDYYYVSSNNEVGAYTDSSAGIDNRFYAVSNYFNDEQFANQVALHQLLYRKLLKFAYDNECEDTAVWDTNNEHWYILYNSANYRFVTDNHCTFKMTTVYFSSKEAAERAIKEVVEPFMKEHPEFVW